MCSICLMKNDWASAYHLGADISSDVETRHYTGGASQGSSGIALVDGMLSGAKWDGLTITYNFPATSSLYGAGYQDVAASSGFAQLDLSMQATTRTAFAMIASLTNANFTELSTTTVGSQVDIALGQSTNPNTAFAYYPSSSQVGGDVWFGRGAAYATNGNQYANPVLGDYNYLTFLHEIGHSMGLKHSHESGGIAGAVVASRDDMEFTVMSYRSYIGDPISGGYGNETYSFAQSYMMLDIAALQAMYGADYSTNATDSIYTFNASTGEMLINGVGQGTPGGNHIFRTIWDGGGNDTYNTSNYSENQNVSLAAGSWSLFSTAERAQLDTNIYARANTYNALLVAGDTRALIENAVTGSGNDRISGNEVANTLSGLDGGDTLVGHGGNDVLNGGNGADILYGDFEPPLPPVAPPAAPYTLGSGIATVAQTTVHNSTATAINMSGNVSFASVSTIQDSTTIAHSTVNATANGTADWYKVTLNATNRVIVDIDNTSTDYDSYVRIFAANGTTELAYNDDGDLDAGSSGIQDSFLSYTAAVSGTFYIVVGTYASTSTVASGVTYVLNVSTDVTAIVVDVAEAIGIAGDDFLYGGAGNDTLDGGAGNDVLDGGADSDTFIGSNGFDTITGGTGVNIANYAGFGSASLTVYLDGFTGTVLKAGGVSGQDTLSGIQTVIADNGNNIIVLKNGAYTVNGGSGNDIYLVDNSADVITDAGGFDSLITTVSFTVDGSIEYMKLNGNNLTATNTAATGTVTMESAGNNNVLNGGLANNIYLVNGTGTTVTDTGGTNTVISYATNFTLGTNVNIGAVVVNNATLTGNNAGCVLQNFGTGGTLIGGTGNDLFQVTNNSTLVQDSIGGGYDVLWSVTADYTLAANIEQLVVLQASGIGRSNAAGGVLISAQNNVRLISGTGNDTLFGNGLNTTFQFNAGFGHDVIGGFTAHGVTSNDRIDLSSLMLAGGMSAITLTAGMSGAVDITTVSINGTPGHDILLYGINAASLSALDFMI